MRVAMLESPHARVRCHWLRTYTTPDDVEDAHLMRFATLQTRSWAQSRGTISAGL